MTTLERALSPADHRRVASFVQQAAGIQLPERKRSLVESRLRRRMALTGHGSIGAYLDFALSSDGVADEQAMLIDALTTNKTDFFRESQHFGFLESWLVEQGIGAGQGESTPLQFWSAGCSTGEEPYTLAMVLSEFRRVAPGFTFTIKASDIAQSVLEKARDGIYAEPRVAPVPMELRRRYLLRSRDRSRQLVRVRPEIRQAVHFFMFNLLSEAYPKDGSLDVIFCRNVMIYFSEADRGRIIDRFRRCLRPGGLLFIGHSESIGRQRTMFDSVIPTVYRRREDRS